MNKNDSFSVREGIVSSHAQTGRLDLPARIALYNLVLPILKLGRVDLPPALVLIAQRFLGLPSDEILTASKFLVEKDILFGTTQYTPFARHVTPEFQNGVRSLFMDREWHTVFDFIETIYAEFGELAGNLPLTAAKFCDAVNQIMEAENVGYRLVRGRFDRSPLLGGSDREAVEKAALVPFANAGGHVIKARAFLIDRKNPDYANSMKESISAVEALANELTGGKDKTLPECLPILEQQGYRMHPAFRDALKKLYGFASDESGVRHGGGGDPVQTDQATARFMLVTVSAFVNYIAALAAKNADRRE